MSTAILESTGTRIPSVPSGRPNGYERPTVISIPIMLNDRLETVIANYAHLLKDDMAEKAYRLIEERYNQRT